MSEVFKIVKIRKDIDGDISDVMLDNGSVLPINHAIVMAKDFEIADVIVVRGKTGGEFLHGVSDVIAGDSLNNLPTF